VHEINLEFLINFVAGKETQLQQPVMTPYKSLFNS